MTALSDADYWRGWRTHQEKPGIFAWCQHFECDKPHFITTLKGSEPIREPWDGMLDSDGKVGK